VNRPHLATSLRCTMYDAMWQLCTDAMATLAFFAEACLHLHVVLFDALSLQSDSVFTLPCAQMHQTAMLVARPYHTYIVGRCFYRCKCLNSRTRRQQGGWHPHPYQQLSR